MTRKARYGGMDDLYRVTEQGELQRIGSFQFDERQNITTVCLDQQTACRPQTERLRHPLAEAHVDFTSFYDGVPWWLDDCLPRGYMGQAVRAAFSKAYPSLDPTSPSAAMTYLTDPRFGLDLPGHFIVGQACAEAFEQRKDKQKDKPVRSIEGEDGRARSYPALAERADRGQVFEAPVCGFFKKFTAVADGKPVIVKFARAGSIERDLLLCESIASSLVPDLAGKFPPITFPSTLRDIGDYSFLEIERFDRNSNGGRYGVVSLGAMYYALVGRSRHDWVGMAGELEKAGLIAPITSERIWMVERFGELILNHDMHAGNLSFFLSDSFPLKPAPVYDMLPMAYMPHEGELPDYSHWMPPMPKESMPEFGWGMDLQPFAAALGFWDRVANDASIRPALRSQARQHAERINAARHDQTSISMGGQLNDDF